MTKTFFAVPVLLAMLLYGNAFCAGGWKLFWADNFDSTALNEQNWNIQTANPGWVNSEQQRYTAGHDQATSNITVKNGNLNIFALKNQSTGEITSGRIYSQNKKTFQYGRMEARMRLPITKGYWPAFWMLGTTGGWPSCGEIDIMEGKGRMPNWTSGSFHSDQGTPVQTASYSLPAAQGNLHDSFHIYAVEWNADSIRWYLDNVNFETMTKAAHPGIPISNTFYFILNVAVGGNFDGNSDNTTVYPETLVVDYVHVYKWDQTLGAQQPASLAKNSHVSLTNSRTFVTLALPYKQPYSAEIVNATGTKLLSVSGNAASLDIPTSKLSQGVYVISVRGDFGTFSDRIIVRRN